MTRARIKRGVAAAIAFATATAAVVVGAASGSSAAATAPSRVAFGIAGNGTLMLQFWTDTPDENDWVRRIGPLSGDTSIVGIDVRVQDGKLYGVGNQGGIYTFVNAVATKVSQLTVPLYGTKFGVDFNPAADRLRVVSDNGQNLRHDLNTHTTVEDNPLSTPPGGLTRAVTAAAYTNNDLDSATATTLFDINTATDQVVIQSPANNGTLAPTGSLGLDAGLDAGFDIFSDLSGGRTVAVQGFAALTPASTGLQSFYMVDLLTGMATLVGVFPLDVTDVAVALDAS